MQFPKFDIMNTITALSKQLITKAMSGVLRRLLIYTKGVTLGKLDKNKPNPRIGDDVQPIVICDSVIRILDNVCHK